MKMLSAKLCLLAITLSAGCIADASAETLTSATAAAGGPGGKPPQTPPQQAIDALVEAASTDDAFRTVPS